jgi:hypothetical protein
MDCKKLESLKKCSKKEKKKTILEKLRKCKKLHWSEEYYQSESSDLKKYELHDKESADKMMDAPFLPHRGKVESKEVSAGLWHHFSMTSNGVNESHLHHISTSPDPANKEAMVAQMAVIHYPNPRDQSHTEFPFITGVKTKRETQGKGYGRALYHEAISTYGGLHSDTKISEDAHNKIWIPMSSDPNYKVDLSKLGERTRHTVRVVGAL